MFDVTPARSFMTEDEARSFVTDNKCDFGPDNLTRAGVGWVVIDPTPRPDLWKNHKIAPDTVAASVDGLTNRLDGFEHTTSEYVKALATRIENLDAEISSLRTEIRENNKS